MGFLRMKTKKINDLEIALEQVGKKFDLLVVNSIAKHRGRAGFNQLLKDINSLNPRTLSTRLKDLEKNKIITKGLIIGTPVKTEYALTQKGKKLIPIIKELKLWIN
jgi:DNA-binding HxlR family transcriptional regulator